MMGFLSLRDVIRRHGGTAAAAFARTGRLSVRDDLLPRTSSREVSLSALLLGMIRRDAYLFGSLQCAISNVGRQLVGGPPSVACWLDAHPAIAQSIKWQDRFETSAYDVPESAKRPWPSWPGILKDALSRAFDDAWKWYFGQANPLNRLDETLAYPPANLSETLDRDTASPAVVVDTVYAWDLYVRWIALNLLVEIGNLVPWSVLDYNAAQLQILFDSAAIMSRRPDALYTVCNGYPELAHFVKRKDNLGASLVGPPRYTYAFLVANRVLGATRYQTIAALLQWVSYNLSHFNGASSYGNMQVHWQYRGIPPVTRIIEGTTSTQTNEFRHWTAGCHGTTGFLRNVLRAANVPVQIVRVCGHALAFFITEGLYLDHGDNPYALRNLGSDLPASQLLIDEATYVSWFGPNPDNHDQNCENIGHQLDVLTAP